MTETNKRFGFVVLHYGGEEVTVQCVEAIRKHCSNYNTEIVLVDNCSPDGSGKRLQEQYKNEERIHVILTEKNLGFANGNNVGFKKAKDLGCDYICVMNNDVFLQDDVFCSQIDDAYRKYHYGVLGPHVTLPGNKENLMQFQLKSLDFYESELKRISRLNRYYSSRLYPLREMANRFIRSVQRVGRNVAQTIKGYKQSADTATTAGQGNTPDYSIYHQVHEQVLLHGCCLIFSEAYSQKFDNAFNEKTFMFREEELLFLRCMEQELKTVYEPTINILHLEDVSTNSVCRTNRQKEIFICSNQEKSLGLLIEEMKKSNTNNSNTTM